MTEPLVETLTPFIRATLGKKAQDVVVLDVRGLTSIADAFIICSGRSSRQVSAIADHIKRTLKKQDIKPLHVEGTSQDHWVVLDYGLVVIHVFYQETRRFYDLEGLWSEAEKFTFASHQGDMDSIAPDKPIASREIIID